MVLRGQHNAVHDEQRRNRRRIPVGNVDCTLLFTMKRKPIVGETLYKRRIGYAAERYGERPLEPVIVRSVGRKYFVCSHAANPTFTTKYHIESWRNVSEYASSQKLYESIADWEEELEFTKLILVVRKAINDQQFNLEQLRAIAGILGINPQINH